MKSALQQSWRFISYIFGRFIKDDLSYRAAALTYTSLLSLVPLFVVSFTILSAFPDFRELATQTENFIFRNFIPESGEAIQTYLHGFVTQTTKLSAVGFIFLIITAVMMLYTMEQAFNAIWRVKSRHYGVSSFLLYWAILTLSPILMGVSIVMSSYVFSLPFISDTAKNLGIYEVALAFVPTALTVFAFTLMYVAIPNCHVKLRYGFISAVVATILFEMARWGFTFYITSFPTYRLLYGALAAIPLFLLWVYISWLIILFGALLTYSLTFHHSIRYPVRLDAFNHMVVWLKRLWQAQSRGDALSLAELVKKDGVAYEVKPEVMLDTLVDAKIISKTGRSYLLCKDFNRLTLAELYHSVPWKLGEAENLTACRYSDFELVLNCLNQANAQMEDVLQIPLAELFANTA